MARTATVGLQAAAYALDVAKALKDLDDRNCDDLLIYVSEIRFGFEGEDYGMKLIPDEISGEGFVLGVGEAG